jgi:predicted oxidoreductase
LLAQYNETKHVKTIALGASSLCASRLAYGCWRIADTWNPAEVNPKSEAAGRRAVVAAFEAGYTLFDHADIYCDGAGEMIFGRVLKEVSGMRAGVVIATKCGIRKPAEPRPDSPYRYDFSAAHLIGSCEQSLKRLGVETVDLFQLHRPDWLMNPEEVAGAFAKLKQAGKAREFGVSNFKPSQVTALQSACPMRLLVNQVEISLAKRTSFDDGTLEQCLIDKITPMAWSPLAGGQLGDGAKKLLPSQEGYQPQRFLPVLDAVAQAHGASRTTMALAWLLKHPSGIVPIIGSTNPQRIREATRACDVELSRDEWYRLLEAARGERLP